MRRSECITAVMVFTALGLFAFIGEASASATESTKAEKAAEMPA